MRDTMGSGKFRSTRASFRGTSLSNFNDVVQTHKSKIMRKKVNCMANIECQGPPDCLEAEQSLQSDLGQEAYPKQGPEPQKVSSIQLRPRESIEISHYVTLILLICCLRSTRKFNII